ncbi:hypothetical protein ENBRE01_1585 [Enteropsectra breve]|nr:hypothetical protein ENBRE01_1585 [Enteropsectra breve]
MFFVTLLIQCLCASGNATEEEKQQKAIEDQLFEDLTKNREAILDAEERGLTEVYLPCPMPNRKQMYNLNELRNFLDKEKNAQAKNKDGNNHKNEYNDILAARCVVCLDPFFAGKKEESLFRKRVYKTHNQLPVCVMCPNPRCSGGRICCTCIRTLIIEDTQPNLFRVPVKYYDIEKKLISDQRMVTCPVCRIYLNFELSALEQIPEDANLSNRDKLNYIEDLVNNQAKTHWLLEIESSLDAESAGRLYTTVFGLNNVNITRDASLILLSEDLSAQYNFYTACSHKYKSFAVRAFHIYTFIKNCTENINYPFITDLKDIIASSDLSPYELEKEFKNICSGVPIGHADKFTLLYYSMILGYFEKTKDVNMNRNFIIRWIMSKYSFILTGFQHRKQHDCRESQYFPYVGTLYDAFTAALHDPRLFDNIIKYNALEFTYKRLIYYPRPNFSSYEYFITNLMEKYYQNLKKENITGEYKDIFVNRHSADARRFSYPIYKKILKEKAGLDIGALEFNSASTEEMLVSLPAFIYDAILKIVFTMAPVHFDHIAEKVTTFSTLYINRYDCDESFTDYLREVYKAQNYRNDVIRERLARLIKKRHCQPAVLLFKHLPNSFATQTAIELFQRNNKLEQLLIGIQKLEFVNWENETPIYSMLKQHCRRFIPQLLVGMSKQPSCFFEVPNEEIDYLIKKYHDNYNNYRRIGSLAFVCRNKELLESFRDDLEGILNSWGFAQSLDKFYKGVISPEGTKSMRDLPFFRIYHAELFLWLDKNIASNDIALKISRMLMVAKLATRDLTDRMGDVTSENNSAGVIPGKKIAKSSGSSIFALEKDMLKAVGRTSVGHSAFSAFQCYLSVAFKKHLEEKALANIIAIEGAESAELLQEWCFRGYYRKLLKLQKELNLELGMVTCCEGEMRKLLEMLSVLQKIEGLGALSAIKKKSEIKGVFTEINFYTENIAVLPMRVCKIVFRYL